MDALIMYVVGTIMQHYHIMQIASASATSVYHFFKPQSCVLSLYAEGESGEKLPGEMLLQVCPPLMFSL